MNRAFLSLIFALLLQTHLFSQAHNQALTQRTENATNVFEGKIVSQTSFWNTAGTRIFTTNQVKVSKVFKGDVPQTIEVITHGGMVEGVMHHIDHSISLPLDGEGVFFCKHFDNSLNPADRFLMLNGQSGVIYYDFGTKGVQARDKFAVYNNLQREVLDEITAHTNMPPIVYQQNGFEQSIQNWLNENIALFTMNDTIIEFTFDNIQIIGVSEVEFDVLVKCNTDGIKFAATDIFLQYNTEAFGESVVQNGMVTANKRTVIEDDVYSLNLVDHAPDIIELVVTSNLQPVDFYPLSPTFEELLDVTLNIENFYELANISFDEVLMVNESMFYNENTGQYVGFSKIVVSPPFNPFDMPDIMNFFGEDVANPHNLTAGTQEVLTIIGSGFEDVVGTVEFWDADDIFGVVQTSPSDIISWTDLQIQLTVPSSDADFSGHTASTGFIKVVLPDGEETDSDDPLIIDYSVYNFRSGGGTSIPINLGDAEAGDGDDNGTLVFSLSNDMHSNVAAREILEQSICDWNVETQINWELAGAAVANVTAADGDMVNLIYFGDEMEFTGDLSSLGAYTVLALGGNNRRVTCTGAGHVFQREIDIVFREGGNLSNADPDLIGWHYTDLAMLSDPGFDEVDFYSYALHELGHAHMLRHVLEDQKIMNVPQGGGYVNRGFEPEDAEGGEFVLSSSEDRYNAGGGCLAELHTTFVTTMLLCDGIDHVTDISSQTSPITYRFHEGELAFSLPNTGYAGSYVFTLYSIDGKQLQQNTFDVHDGETEKSVILRDAQTSGFYVFELANTQRHMRFSGKLVVTH